MNSIIISLNLSLSLGLSLWLSIALPARLAGSIAPGVGVSIRGALVGIGCGSRGSPDSRSHSYYCVHEPHGEVWEKLSGKEILNK
jgi:hypothetical protein